MSRISIIRVLNNKSIPAFLISAPLLAVVGSVVLGGIALAAQDRYTLKLGKLSFADFKGYEDWKDVAVSQTETQLKVIVANDVMMKAYRQGLPATASFFPKAPRL